MGKRQVGAMGSGADGAGRGWRESSRRQVQAPGPWPRLGLSSWTKGKFLILIQAPYWASESGVEVQISASPLLSAGASGRSPGLSELQFPK